MFLRLRHLCLCLIAVAGSLAGGEAQGAFLPPDFETASSGPARPSESPREAPRPERLEVAALASSSSMSGPGTASVVTGGGQGHCVMTEALAQPSAVFSRLQLAVERVRPCRGFLPEILRPPRA